MRILLLGSDTFAEPLARLGHEPLVCGPGRDAFISTPDPDPDWNIISKELKNKAISLDALLVTDDVGSRKLPTGIWMADTLTVFYGVDSPLNRFWQHPYARLFDLALLDQKAEAYDLGHSHPNAYWLPVGIDEKHYLGSLCGTQKKGVCFVGVVNKKVRPKRSVILDKVSSYADLVIKGGRKGEWLPVNRAAELYRTYQVVLNENLFPGVTTRPLEGMASGGCVLSEEAPGNMDYLFEDMGHLCFYGPHNLKHKLEMLLKDSGLRKRLAKQGRELTLEKHTLLQRAADIVSHIEMIKADPRPGPLRAQGIEALRLEGEALLMAGLRWPAKSGPQRLLRAAGRLEAVSRRDNQSLDSLRLAALGSMAAGEKRNALNFSSRAAEYKKPCDMLKLALIAAQVGNQSVAWDALALLGRRRPDLAPKAPGGAWFHLAAARLLLESENGVSPGFNRKKLPMPFWGAFEHLLESVALDPMLSDAWELGGDVLMGQGAALEAHGFYRKAVENGADDIAAVKERKAAEKGYLL